MKIILAVLIISATTYTLVGNKKTKESDMNNVFELAINQAKENQLSNFLDTREKFVEVLGKEKATLNEGKWKPFFTVDPNINLETILVGMTHWNSMQGFGEVATKLMPQKEAKDYFSTFNPLVYALLEPIDGNDFDLESIKKSGNVIEFAVRTGKSKDAFAKPREDFFASLENYDGFKFSREFKVYELNESGMPVFKEDTQAVIIVWESIDKFQKAATPIFQSNEYAEFAKNVDVSSYFATTTKD